MKNEDQKFTINLGGTMVSLEIPLVMGILNVTPDSFFDGGQYENEDRMLVQTEKMLAEGAAIIDVGGASSKPNAAEIPEQDEIKKVATAVKVLVKRFSSIKISVDTFRSSVAKAAIAEGAVMINDISGGELDNEMFETAGKYKIPYILMHMKGTPQTMTAQANYDDIILEMTKYFQEKIIRLKAAGVKDIIIDLGFGFSKNMNQNFGLLKKMPYFKMLNLPLLVGVSRKSMIYKYLDVSASEALNGTSVLNTIALCNGANILRVHDVRQAVEAVNLYHKISTSI